MKLQTVFSGFFATGFLALAATSAFAQDYNATTQPASNTTPSSDITGAETPAPMNNSNPAIQAQDNTESRRPFTVIATVREQYDDNIYTTHSNKVDAYETLIEPSILFNYPIDQTLLSARYDFGATYYPDRDPSWDMSHQFLARINHSFSDRFNIDARDRVLYTNQPEVTSGATVNRLSGDYFNNTFTLQGTAAWTPKFNTITTYTNDYFHYNDDFNNLVNDRDENMVQHDFRFLLTPTLTLVAGGTFTDLSYLNTYYQFPGYAPSRDWDSFTGYVGVDYNFTPQFLAGVRGGGVITEYDALGSQPVNPYAMAFFNWQLGARSSLQFNYTHTMGATDIAAYASAVDDSLTLTGRYQLTPKITASLQGNYTMAENKQDASLIGAAAGNYNENTLGVSAGLGYDFTRYLNFNIAYTFANVSSDSDDREYTRNQISLGLTATY